MEVEEALLLHHSKKPRNPKKWITTRASHSAQTLKKGMLCKHYRLECEKVLINDSMTEDCRIKVEEALLLHLSKNFAFSCEFCETRTNLKCELCANCCDDYLMLMEMGIRGDC